MPVSQSIAAAVLALPAIVSAVIYPSNSSTCAPDACIRQASSSREACSSLFEQTVTAAPVLVLSISPGIHAD